MDSLFLYSLLKSNRYDPVGPKDCILKICGCSTLLYFAINFLSLAFSTFRVSIFQTQDPFVNLFKKTSLYLDNGDGNRRNLLRGRTRAFNSLAFLLLHFPLGYLPS